MCEFDAILGPYSRAVRFNNGRDVVQEIVHTLLIVLEAAEWLAVDKCE